MSKNKIINKIENAIHDFAALHNLISGICNHDDKSIIVIGKPYPPSTFKNLSSLACGTDYHVTLTNILKELNSNLGLNGTIMVDNGPLIEKPLAVKAGLGHLGKNGLVISPTLGSFFNIGLIVTDTQLTPSAPSTGSCPADCRICQETCPSGDIADKQKCVSYLTQKRGNIAKIEPVTLCNQLYGCDICQLCCPFNKVTSPPTEVIDPVEILSMTEEYFDTRFGHTAMAWRGLRQLKRNARVIISHAFSTEVENTIL